MRMLVLTLPKRLSYFLDKDKKIRDGVSRILAAETQRFFRKLTGLIAPHESQPVCIDFLLSWGVPRQNHIRSKNTGFPHGHGHQIKDRRRGCVLPSASLRSLRLTPLTPYGIQCYMAAKLLLQEKFVYADGSMMEMVLWMLPEASMGKSHGPKYRLYYGSADGTNLVRYDNETGKGDHRHYGDLEEPYPFVDVETLVKDFLKDVTRVRGGHK